MTVGAFHRVETAMIPARLPSSRARSVAQARRRSYNTPYSGARPSDR